ncbi:MAG: glycoside hydrolase family 75 protein [Bryobacteraceae bacterium]
MSTRHAVDHHSGPKLVEHTYQPIGAAAQILGGIVTLFLHPKTQEIGDGPHHHHHLEGKEYMCTFPGGQLYFQSKLDLDTDGSRYWRQDHTGQPDTAVHYADGTPMDADRDNYFVLPGGFYGHYKIGKGDIGVVIYGNRKAYACFGDVGGPHKLGEGSIALHRALGHETIHHRRLTNRGIHSGVITIVFPGSGNGKARTSAESLSVGEPLFRALQREGDAIGNFEPSMTSNIA